MHSIPNGSPEVFTLSAILVAFLLIDDTTSNEQDDLGNWFMLLGQTLCTNSAHLQVLEERGNYQFSSHRTPRNGNLKDTNIVTLEKAVKAMQKQIDELKSKASNKPT